MLGNSLVVINLKMNHPRGISSVGRTSDLHSEGQEFDSLILHHYGTLVQFG